MTIPPCHEGAVTDVIGVLIAWQREALQWATKCRVEPLAGSCIAASSGFGAKQAVPSYICNAAAWLWRCGAVGRNGTASLWPQSVRWRCAVGESRSVVLIPAVCSSSLAKRVTVG